MGGIREVEKVSDMRACLHRGQNFVAVTVYTTDLLNLSARYILLSSRIGKITTCIPRISSPILLNSRQGRRLNTLATMEQAEPIRYNGKEYDIVQEGLAEILSPRQERNIQPSKKRKSGEDQSVSPAQAVFYNPVQQFNRDLSVLAIKVFSEDLAAIQRNRYERRLEALARKRQCKVDRRKPTEAVEVGTVVKNQTPGDDVPDTIETPSKAPANAFLSENPEDNVESELVEIEQGLTSSGNAMTKPKPNPPTTVKGAAVDFAVNEVERISERTATDKPTNNGPTNDDRSLEKGSNRNIEQSNGQPANTPRSIDLKFRVCDALSATGLRAIRYAKEIPRVTQVIANDLSPTATTSIALNICHNEVNDKVIPTTSEAQLHLSASASKPDSKYEVVDLDPYGTAVPFLDSAIQALIDGGLLCVTCTDASLFASMGYLEKTFTLYRGLPFKGQQSHEVGLRLILHTVATSAASYGIAIEPLLSISADFYVRLFIRVRRNLNDTKFLGGKTQLLYYCGEGCGAFSTQPIVKIREMKDKIGQPIYKYTQALAPTTTPSCEHCDFKQHLAGPMWGGPIHNPHFVQRILDTLPDLDSQIYGTIPRIKGMLTVARDETFPPEGLIAQPTSPQQTSATTDTATLAIQPISSLPPSYLDPAPLFIHPPSLCKALHCNSPPDAAVRGALLGLGYRVSRSHTSAGSIKTDAPWSIIWEVMREWTRQRAPIKKGAITKGTAGWGLMKRDRSNVIVATLKEELEAVLKGKDTLKDITDGIQGALYRAMNNPNTYDQEVNGDEAKREHHEVNGNAESFKDQDTPFGNDTIQTHVEKDPLSPLKDKKLRERNTYKQERRGASPDGISSTKPIITHPGHQPLTALQRSELNVVFDEKLGSESGVQGLVRYQMNPRENWGPMKKAKTS